MKKGIDCAYSIGTNGVGRRSIRLMEDGALVKLIQQFFCFL
jgi:hypothetical protein